MTSTPNLSRAQLFFDDSWVEQHAKLQRIWHPLRKQNAPVLRADRPWESRLVALFGTVMKRGDRYHMWYMAFTRKQFQTVCYAVSDDGVSWEKPSLGLHEFEGSKDNNIIVVPKQSEGFLDDITVIDDPDDTQWPLKALYWDKGNRNEPGKQGYHAIRSKDGIHWDYIGFVLPEWGDRFNALPHRYNGKFIVYGRHPSMHTLGGRKGRVVAYIESEDLINWSEPELMLQPDLNDPVQMQFYSANAFAYEDWMVGSIERMHFCPDVLDAELIFSRDARNWSRPHGRPALLERGPAGHWDHTWVNLATMKPIVEKSQLWFYYGGRTVAHGAAVPGPYGDIGIATLRVDGFCSLKAEGSPGYFRTPVFEWVDGELLVNVDPRRNIEDYYGYAGVHGELRVEVLDESGKTIEGFSREQCLPVTRNTANPIGKQIDASLQDLPPAYETVHWDGDRSLRELKGRAIKLVFHMRDAHLYSFRAGNATEKAVLDADAGFVIK